MFDIFNIIPDCIIAMVSILGGMGTGSNTGKISFKKITSAGNLEISESCTSLTFNLPSGSGDITAIPQNRMVFGNTATGITFSNNFIMKAGGNGDYSSIHGNSLYGFGSVIVSQDGTGDTSTSDKTLNVSSINNCPGKSFIIGGGNKICSAVGSIIIGGFTNSICLNTSSFSSIVSGYRNIIKSSAYSTILSSFCSEICNNSLQSFIMSSQCSTILSNNTKFHSIISSFNSHIDTYDGSGGDKHNQIVSSGASYICNTGSSLPGCNVANQILASRASKIKICGRKDVNEGFSKFNSIIASGTSTISATNSCVPPGGPAAGLSSSYNSIIASEFSELKGGKHNSIISSCCSEITNSKTSLGTGYNTIIGSRDIAIRNMDMTAVISSRCLCLPSPNGITSCSAYNTLINECKTSIGNDTLYSTFIGGRCNSIFYCFSSTIGGFKNKIGKNLSHIVGGSYNYVYNSVGFANCLCETSATSVILSSKGTTASFFAIGTYNSKFLSLSSGIGGQLNCGAISVISSPPYAERESGNISNRTADHSLIIGGQCNRSESNRYSSIIIASFKSRITNAKNNFILGGASHFIDSKGPYYDTSDNSYCHRSNNSFIIGGRVNRLKDYCSRGTSYFNRFGIFCLENSGIIGSGCSGICSLCTCNSVIIGGFGLTSSKSDTLIIQNLLVSGTFSTSPSSGVVCCGVSGTFNDVKGLCTVNGIVTQVILT